jgi:transposase
MTTSIAENLVPNELWALVAPLLPAPPRPPYGGRRRSIPDRNCLAALVFMARTSTPWRLLPAQELGCGSPATAWRRLDEWARARVFEALHLEVLDRLGEQGRLDWSRVSMDSASVRAKRRSSQWGTTLAPVRSIVASPGPSSTWSASGKACADAGVTAANVNDTLLFAALLDEVPAVLTPAGRRRCRPGTVDADKAYDHAANRAYLRRRRIKPRIARRGIES